MNVLKFGGTSVGTPKNIATIVSIVSSRTDVAAVVVSAFSGVTDILLRLAQTASSSGIVDQKTLDEVRQRHCAAIRELAPDFAPAVTREIDQEVAQLIQALETAASSRSLSPALSDAIAGVGELLSARVVAAAFTSKGRKATFLDAREILVTSSEHQNARVLLERSKENLSKIPRDGTLCITTGFIGRTESGHTTTLGRGGSDYSAAVFAALLDSRELEIWTDVDGMMTADPRKVEKAFPIAELSYEEAMELCHFGAKVIYPPTLQPVIDRNIPIIIKNTMNPGAAGTRILRNATDSGHPITGIASISEISLLSIIGSGLIGVSGTAMRFFTALAQARLNVMLITQASSEHSICVALAPEDANRGATLVREAFASELATGLVNDVRIEPGYSVVSIVGENMRNTPGISGKVFSALGRNGINIVAIAQGSSERNISTVVSRNDERKSLNVIHDSLFLSELKRLHVALVGLGTVGQALLSQLQKQRLKLQSDYSLDLVVVGLANSKKMLVREKGIELEGALSKLDASEDSTDFGKMHEALLRLNLPNLVFVDCTASDDVGALYSKFLDKSISVVAANKRAQSGKGFDFQELHRIAQKRGAELLYETSVGAALPIIGTLRDLRKSGDHIRKVEAVLSGTLSFIFNSLGADPSLSFSEAVRRAKEKGYTEPDPRDDLRGTDVARKVVILGREAGFELELSDVKISPLLPKRLFDLGSVEEFFKELPSVDPEIGALAQAASTTGGKLCALARIESGRAEVSLETLPASHPFQSLSGSDNIVMIVSDRYSSRPLVIQGPGAGADVTAGGVFADILRVANR